MEEHRAAAYQLIICICPFVICKGTAALAALSSGRRPETALCPSVCENDEASKTNRI